MSKKDKLIKFENSFCLSKLKKKKPNKPNLLGNGFETLNKSTETKITSKSHISTVVDFTSSDNGELSLKQKRFSNFPICPDVRGIVFNANRFHGKTRNEDALETDISYSEKISKTPFLSRDSNFDSALRKLSMTLKDILDQNDSSNLIISDSPNKSTFPSFKHLSNKLSNFPNHQVENKPDENDSQFSKMDLFDGKINLCNESSKAREYDYFETTTLLPIGPGVTSITTPKPNSRFIPEQCSPQNSPNLHISLSKLQTFPETSDINIRKIQEQNSPIEIPPLMPPLLSVNPNGYSSLTSFQFLNRRRIISENNFYKKINTFQGSNIINENDDYDDIDSLSFRTENDIGQKSPRSPSSCTKADFKKPMFYENDLSNTELSFSHLPTKSSSSFSLSKSKVINRGNNPSLNVSRNLQNHISTAF